MNRFILLISIALTFSTAITYSATHVILIDPGHGGAEGGAEIKLKSKTINEKELTLKFAHILKDILKKKYRTYLTREDDTFVSLGDRAKMADEVKADLIISLHFNSSTYSSAEGIETYYLDNHMDKAVKKVEHIENILPGNEDFIINHILIDLAIKLTSTESQRLAKLIHEESVKSLKKKYKIKDRGYKPGLFYVLALSKRPGVLIEGGFMSNSSELKKIHNNEDYLKQYAQGIAQGIHTFFEKQ